MPAPTVNIAEDMTPSILENTDLAVAEMKEQCTSVTSLYAFCGLPSGTSSAFSHMLSLADQRGVEFHSYVGELELQALRLAAAEMADNPLTRIMMLMYSLRLAGELAGELGDEMSSVGSDAEAAEAAAEARAESDVPVGVLEGGDAADDDDEPRPVDLEGGDADDEPRPVEWSD